jgi:hypothetical protein
MAGFLVMARAEKSPGSNIVMPDLIRHPAS